MSEIELKNKLIDKIRETDDPSILEELSNFFELQEPEPIYEVNKQQRDAIEKGKEQLRNGQTIDNSRANKDIDEWLNK